MNNFFRSFQWEYLSRAKFRSHSPNVGKFTFPSRKKSPLSLIAVERGGYGIDKGANNEKEITRDVEISWDIRSHLRGPGRCAERERDSIDIKLDEHWSIL